MKKRITVLIFLCVAVALYPGQSMGLLDDAKPLGREERQMGFVLGFSHDYGFAGLRFDDINSFWVSSFVYIPVDTSIYKYNFSTLRGMAPVVELGFMGRWGLKNDKEFSFETTLSTPSAYRFNFFGPSINMFWGVKKSYIRTDRSNAAFKFNWGLYYSAYPGVGFAIRSSFLFGSNKKRINKNLIFYLQTELKIGLPMSLVEFYYFYNGTARAVATPGVEVNISVNHPRGFTFIWSLYTELETELDIAPLVGETGYFGSSATSEPPPDSYYYFYRPPPNNLIATFRVGMKFGWQNRYTKKSRVDWDE